MWRPLTEPSNAGKRLAAVETSALKALLAKLEVARALVQTCSEPGAPPLSPTLSLMSSCCPPVLPCQRSQPSSFTETAPYHDINMLPTPLCHTFQRVDTV